MADVPKIIHQFWDRETPPDDVGALIQSWRDHHPAWRHILWNDETAASFIRQTFGAAGERCFNACLLPAMRADVFRLAALLVHGGVYVDADMQCVGPVDEVARQPTLYVGMRRHNRSFKIKNGFMIDVPDAKLFRWGWKMAMRNIASNRFPGHVSRMTGPMMLTRVWSERLTDEDRAPYQLLRGRNLSAVFVARWDLSYREEGGHWPDQVEAGQGAGLLRPDAVARPDKR